MKKKTIGMIAGVCALAAIASLTAYAYLTHVPSERKNTVYIGENAISIDENFPAVTAQETENIHEKRVSITNSGDTPCFVRVYLAFSDSGAAAVSAFAAGETEPAADAAAWKAAENYVKDLPDGWVYQTFDGTDWATPAKISPDGWYYYTGVLGAGEQTTELIDWVRTNYEDARDIQDFDIYVYSESVQSVLDSGAAGDYKAAWAEYLYPGANGGGD